MTDDKLKTVKDRDGKDVEILDSNFDAGQPESSDNWRRKLIDRKLMLKYLSTGERYWYGESYGSEKRKNPA
jgi:hypothetical protein